MWKVHETVIKEPDSKGKGSRLEFSIEPEQLYMDINSLLINENSAENGLKINHQPRQVYTNFKLS